MSRKFEQEYRELMREQTPDLWSRIEEGVNNSPRSNGIIEFKPEGFSRKATEVKRRRSVNHYQFRALAGAAACFVLLLIGIPALRTTMTAEKEAKENIPTVVIDGSQAQPMEESQEGSYGKVVAAENTEAVAASSDEQAEAVKTESSEVNSEQEKTEPAKNDAETAPVVAAADVNGNVDVQPAAETVTVAETVDTAADAATVQAETGSEIAMADEESGDETSEADVEDGKNSDKKNSDKKGSDKKDASSDKKTDNTSAVAKVTASTDNKAAAKTADNSSITVDEAEDSEDISAVGSDKTEVVYAKVEISIKSVKAEGGKCVYTATVVKDPSGKLAAGTKILVQAAANDFVSGRNYTATLTDNGSTAVNGEKLYISSDITMAAVDSVTEEGTDVLEIS